MPRPAWLPLAVGAVAGVALALVVTLVQPAVYRATATLVLTRPGAAPADDPALAEAAAAAARLLRSGVVAESAARNLRAGESGRELLDRTTVTVGSSSSLLEIAVEGGDRDGTRKAAQELAQVFSVLYNERFGGQARASLWDAPEASPPRVAPRPLLNLALGLVLGIVAGAAVRWREALPQRLRRRPAARRPPPPPPAPPVAVSEPVPVLEPLPVPEPEAEPVPEPEPEPVAPEPVQAPFVLPERGSWTIDDVDALLAEHGHAFPDRLAELQVYADTMRDVAEPDGKLPAGVEVVVEDAFADLIARAR